jgi:patatin-like phospholipase
MARPKSGIRPIVESGIRRILTMDGGGLYGLTSALWLRQLCEGDERFLAPGNVQLFGGCSAGALNALLLAREPDPRKFVLAGGLENFWRQPGTFSNSNPVTAFWSLFQVTAWYGAEDFLQLLRAVFGDMTLADLPAENRVLITSFNWTGARDACTGAAWNPYGCPPGCPPWFDPWTPWAAMGGQGASYPAAPNPADLWGGIGSNARGWRPKFFKNFPAEEPDRRCRLVDIAYAAASPPGLRAVLNGFGDGGTFNACPSADAIAAAVAEERRLRDLPADESNDPADEARLVAEVLQNLRMLSVGVGAKNPAYWLRFIDMSFTQFNLYPTNPLAGNWYSPAWSVGLDGPSEDAVYISRQLLAAGFHRLNPGLLDMPTLVACIWSRFPVMREWLTQQIYCAVQSPDSQQAVRQALDFLNSGWHNGATANNVEES